MRLLAIALILFMTGCFSHVNNFPSGISVDDFKKECFTDEAYEAIKDIPVLDGFVLSGHGYASGVNAWSNIASLISFNGIGRKVIIKWEPGFDYKPTLIHEYIHHIDDMTRDGEISLINLDEFIKAYTVMAYDPKYINRINYIEQKSSWWATDLFGVGSISEHIAYSANILWEKGGPDYMKWVFRKIFRKYEKIKMPEIFIYMCPSGHEDCDTWPECKWILE